MKITQVRYIKDQTPLHKSYECEDKECNKFASSYSKEGPLFVCSFYHAQCTHCGRIYERCETCNLYGCEEHKYYWKNVTEISGKVSDGMLKVNMCSIESDEPCGEWVGAKNLKGNECRMCRMRTENPESYAEQQAMGYRPESAEDLDFEDYYN